MTHTQRDAASSGILAWTAHASNLSGATEEEEVAAEVDEPPERRRPTQPAQNIFQRTAIRPHHEKHSSLLTKALQSHSDDDESMVPTALSEIGRRRSMTSNISLASTADLTSDTGMTSPSRTNTPSPPLPEMRMLRLNIAPVDRKAILTGPVSHLDAAGAVTPKQEQPPQILEPPKRKSISFACTAKPNGAPAARQVQPVQPAQLAPEIKPLTQDAPRRSCLKFAAVTMPNRSQVANTIAQPQSSSEKPASPSAVRKTRSSAPSRSPRSPTPRRVVSQAPSVVKNKYLTASSKDLTEGSRFHEFARDELHEDDWIRQDTAAPATRSKLTINDTLQKELAIRKLGKEAEEEAEEEQDEQDNADSDAADADNDDEDEDDEDDDEDQGQIDDDDEPGLDDAEDDLSGYDSDDGSSGGYHTDEETGFAASDDEDEDGLHLWTPGRPALRLSGEAAIQPRPFTREEQQSDSSIPSRSSVRARRGSRTRRIKIRPGTPELPDSTDFVCGTLDEDRPMEDAYISCIAARKREKAHLIPQDIDPSFPASDPEDEEDAELFNPVHHESDDDVWLHGEMEDIHQTDNDRMRRKKKGDNRSPKRYHSPPPKKHHSPPPPKARGRSPPPRRLFDRHSPRRARFSPPTQALKSPPASLRNNAGPITFKPLGSRPGLTHTKSLPRPPALFPQLRKGRAKAANLDIHVRGAIDIVKGLQQKRQRRKEKFYQLYCNRARKGQIPERKPQPGQGAERMRELGLLMAGKIDQGNYVLSV